MTSPEKKILFDEEARGALAAGIAEVADAVSFTLGPKGRSVGLHMSFGSPSITNDGYSVAKEIELKDPFANLGASMAKEVASKIKEKAGDGTTTGILLLQALVQGALKNIAAGVSPILLKRGLDQGLEVLLKELDQMALSIKSLEETIHIATVSASGKQEIGHVIAEAFEQVGSDGLVVIEEGKATETTVDLTTGMKIEQGYKSSYFCTNGEKLQVEMENPFVLLIDKKISSAQDLLPILQHIASTGRSLLIIAEDIEADALSTLVVNKLRGTLKVAAIIAPGFGQRRTDLLEDIGAFTGAEVVGSDTGQSLKEAEIQVLGTLEKVTITKDTTTLVGSPDNEPKIQARLAQIRIALKAAQDPYEKKQLEERQAKLLGKVAVIYVGGATDSEMRQKKQIFEDSLNATRAALNEGIVPGGGTALLRASKALSKLKLSKEEQVGVNLLIKATEAPMRQIVLNSGYDAGTAIQEALKKGLTFGFNSQTEKVEDLLASGIIDPVKVVKASIAHAVSVAGIVLMSEALIVPQT